MPAIAKCQWIDERSPTRRLAPPSRTGSLALSGLSSMLWRPRARVELLCRACEHGGSPVDGRAQPPAYDACALASWLRRRDWSPTRQLGMSSCVVCGAAGAVAGTVNPVVMRCAVVHHTGQLLLCVAPRNDVGRLATSATVGAHVAQRGGTRVDVAGLFARPVSHAAHPRSLRRRHSHAVLTRPRQHVWSPVVAMEPPADDVLAASGRRHSAGQR